jgi:hypothetical protein
MVPTDRKNGQQHGGQEVARCRHRPHAEREAFTTSSFE